MHIIQQNITQFQGFSKHGFHTKQTETLIFYGKLGAYIINPKIISHVFVGKNP